MMKRVIVVTGTSSALGALTARELAKAGHAVYAGMRETRQRNEPQVGDESRVHEFVPNSRIGWFGDGTRMYAYHTFLFLGTNGGCHIVTGEVVKGPCAV